MKKLALSMIVKNETQDLDRCLSTIAPYVNGIFITVTGDNKETVKIAEKYGAHVTVKKDFNYVVKKKDVTWLSDFFGWSPAIKQGDELFMFDQARNHSLSQTPKDYKYVMWLDADDIVNTPEGIDAIIDRMDQAQATAIFMNYLYEVEVDPETGKVKNIIIEHLRERIILNDGRYKWIAPIHETLIAQTGEVRQLEDKTVSVVHLSTHDKRTDSIHRNIKVLEKSILDTQGKDPRPIYYLAKAYYDMHTDEYHRKAEKLIYLYLQGDSQSGWAEERAQAWEYLGEIYRERQELNKSIKSGLNALEEYPMFPSTYLSLSLTYLQKGELNKSRFWLDQAAKLPMPQTTLVINPKDLSVRALEILLNVSLKENKLDEAWATTFKLHEMFPQDAGIKEKLDILAQLREERELTKRFVDLAKFLKETNQTSKLVSLTASAPKEIENNPIISQFIQEYTPIKTWTQKEIAIYCGPGYTVWNPDFLKENNGESFIGGSEEAVIYAAKELTNQGYKVTVYGDPGTEGIYDGVEYLNYFKFNPRDQFNILMAWRQPAFFENTYNAKKTYLWLHDVPNPMDYNEKRLKNITKILVLSKAHRILLPTVPDEKFMLTSNGFVEEHPEIKPTYDPYQVIWTSSYDRGLQHLLEMWPDIKKEVPQAKLKIFYGWHLFDKVYYNNPERMSWRAKIEKMMTYDGITHGGRIVQGELEKEIKTSGIWAYPTDFYEINCISAIKAQAFGAVPVVIEYGALSETVQHGIQVQGEIWDKSTKEEYQRQLINMLQGNIEVDRQKMMKSMKDQYTWKSVISSWKKEFTNGTI